MSPYAAGCAVCGAEIDPHRWDTGPSIGQRTSSLLNSVSMGAIPPAVVWALIGFAIVFTYLGVR